MEPNFTEQQSLSLINEMIDRARNNFQKGSGNSMIFNGYAVAFIALANVALAFILPNPNQSFNVWWLMLPTWIIDRIIEKRQDKHTFVRTHIDKIVSSVWTGFGIANALFLIIIFGFGIGQQNPRMFVLITPCIMLMAGLAEFVTAQACRFKPFLIGALIMWGGALTCLAMYFLCGDWAVLSQFFILALCAVLAFTVPGYKLNKLAKDHV